jgi:paraquat-inducible protein B
MMRANNHPPVHDRPARALPVALVKKSRLTWILWLIPAAAAGLCVWFVYRDYISSGPLITLYFQSAEGLENENTLINYRGANVGVVKSVTLTRDTQRVKVTARLAGSARDLARQGAIFWIVRPEVKVGSISGLRTIISGDYIAVQPGTGPPTNTFVGAEKAPLNPEPQALEISFLSPELGSMQEQSPIFYRGVQVGEVDYFQLAPDARRVSMHARIWKQYAPLVRLDSKFWNAGGIDLHFGLFKGVQISAESPKTVISGGIEFATPNELQPPATNGTVFVLNEKPDEKWKTWAPAISLQLPAQAATTNSAMPSYLNNVH